MECTSYVGIIHFIKVNLNTKVNHFGDEYYYTKIQCDLYQAVQNLPKLYGNSCVCIPLMLMKLLFKKFTCTFILLRKFLRRLRVHFCCLFNFTCLFIDDSKSKTAIKLKLWGFYGPFFGGPLAKL
jgi:hypothetical protein